MATTERYHPIIYVRGYSAGMGAIENTVATPYMGFNLGATKLRQSHAGNIIKFVFESPLLRLMKDHGYKDTYEDGKWISAEKTVSPKSVWIFRYYEEASQDLGTGKRQSIPEVALDLRRFILRIRDQVATDAASRKNFRVYLVAHSMGGLVCRCYLQNVCATGTGNAALNKELDLKTRPRDSAGYIKDSVHLVDKVFTYATPHNGIELTGRNVPNLGILDRVHFRNFNRRLIHKYLKFPGDYEQGNRVDSLNKSFPASRFFCLVGSNFRDYHAFGNMSRRTTGEMSDGLVMIRNATVHRAPRAFAHRSHSGHYGIVNSEEGYQNLRRFLFGDVHVDALLTTEEITFPKKIQQLKDKGKEILASYQIETTAKVRGAIPYLHERKFDQASAIRRSHEELVVHKKRVYLFSGYLMKSEKSAKTGDTALAFAIKVGIRVPMYEVNNKLWLDTHFEGSDLFSETLTFEVRHSQGQTTVRYGLASAHGPENAPRQATLLSDAKGRSRIEIPLGFTSGIKHPPRPGFRGQLVLLTEPWNH